MIRNLAADTKRLLYSITAKNIHKLQCYLILALIPTFNSSSFNSLIELRAASILIFYWNINPTANTPSSFWIVERSPNRPAKKMVSFRGQEKLGPRPARSVSFRGLIQQFQRPSPPLSYSESPPPPLPRV